jgi:hypothetical protein
MGHESASRMETKEFCGAPWPSKVLKRKGVNSQCPFIAPRKFLSLLGCVALLSGMRSESVVIVLLDPTSERGARFFQASILRRPDFLFLQTAMEPFDVAVAFRLMICRASMRDAQSVQGLDKPGRKDTTSTARPLTVIVIASRRNILVCGTRSRVGGSIGSKACVRQCWSSP